MVLDKIREARLKLKPSKCQWFKKELTFVGHRVGVNGIQPDVNNVSKINEALEPTNTTELRRFLGMAQYYYQFIKDFSKIARPLFNLVKKDVEYE